MLSFWQTGQGGHRRPKGHGDDDEDDGGDDGGGGDDGDGDGDGGDIICQFVIVRVASSARI